MVMSCFIGVFGWGTRTVTKHGDASPLWPPKSIVGCGLEIGVVDVVTGGSVNFGKRPPTPPPPVLCLWAYLHKMAMMVPFSSDCFPKVFYLVTEDPRRTHDWITQADKSVPLSKPINQ